MNDSELRKVGESIETGDKITIGQLDVELTVTEVIPTDGALNIFAEKKNHPEQGHYTKVEFALDSPTSGASLMIRVYDGENYTGQKISEKSYDSVNYISKIS
ncbi:hypothetical protein [Halorubrum sp. 2020YC2]|uniref:hypothetical protein n=1 Tax=Halorubrum sp. 2020YC2 TaxID=2836432 RepID=UPI001BECD8AB|nr:hypothetical protein [Halorubrum sp. 2020YC2]QWC20723.1 hypothetical protein KI388_07345 [Halorubrum sp. 2020YC2]